MQKSALRGGVEPKVPGDVNKEKVGKQMSSVAIHCVNEIRAQIQSPCEVREGFSQTEDIQLSKL